MKRGPGTRRDPSLRASGREKENPHDLLRLRRQAGLSRRELAELSGISMSAIFSAERGDHKTRPVIEAAIREALAVAILRRKRMADHHPSFSMRCRWCGDRLKSIKFDNASGQMVILDKDFAAFNGWFYHSACLKEKTEIELNNPDDDLT